MGPFGAFQKQLRWRSLAVSYTARGTLVFDIGFNRGLTDTSARGETFMGPTYLLPHRFGKQGASGSVKIHAQGSQSRIDLLSCSDRSRLRLLGRAFGSICATIVQPPFLQ